MKQLLLSLAAASVMFVVQGANATIIFTEGNHPQENESNILFGASETGTTITGEVDHSGIGVDFSTLTGQTLLQKAKGQADIFNAASGSLLNSISVSLADDRTFGDFILNLQGLDGTARISVDCNDCGGTPATFDIEGKSGSNFLTTVAIDGETMTSISVTMLSGTGWTDFKQPRISGVEGFSPGPGPGVPEPATLALLGSALLGYGAMRRRKQNS